MTSEHLYHPIAIGSLKIPGNIFLAPVAGYSDAAFRSICRMCGADFAYTEMVSAEALVRLSEKTQNIMYRASNENIYSVQIFGGVPETMADATKIVIEKTHTELIDINAGCPVPKIIKSGAGSSLTRDPDRLFEITKAVVKAAGSTPVSVKIRSGWDSSQMTWKEAALAALEAGAKAITLHGRTKAQGYEGKANWDILSALVETMNGRIPVFGSGDIFSPEDAKKMLVETKCDGIMIARGAMGNPFIFTQTKALLTTGYYSEIPATERLQTGMKELELLIQEKGESLACREMRKRFCCYSKGITGAATLRKEIVSASTFQEYSEIYQQLIVKSQQST